MIGAARERVEVVSDSWCFEAVGKISDRAQNALEPQWEGTDASSYPPAGALDPAIAPSRY